MEREDPPRQISVSRDALRAELAELKADLLEKIGNKLEQKANAAELVELSKRVDLHEAGVFPPAWELRLSKLVEDSINQRVQTSWALRSSKAGFAYLFVSLGSLGLAVTDFLIHH